MDTKTLLKHIGGQAAIARDFEISDSAVSQWVDDDAIPSARLKYLKLAHPGDHWTAYANHLEGKVTKPANRTQDVPQAPVNIAQAATETVAEVS